MRNLPLLLPPLLVLSLALPACSLTPKPRAPVEEDAKRFAAAVAMICDVDRLAGLAPDADSLGVGLKRTAWITDKVDNPDAIELRVLLSVKGAADQGRMLRARAKDLCITSCALADALEASDSGGLAP
jgi:hypothetical protein